LPEAGENHDDPQMRREQDGEFLSFPIEEKKADRFDDPRIHENR
jgi:hypothetical protein